MAVIYHTNGTADLYIGNSTYLGLSSADGVKMSLNTYNNEIMSDERGPNIPSEVLQNGTDAAIEFELWKFDTTVLNTLFALREGGTQGLLNQVGGMMFTNSRTFTLTIRSPVDGQNWQFPRCWIQEEASVQLSTQLKIWTLKIRAVPGPSSSTPNVAVLYQFV